MRELYKIVTEKIEDRKALNGVSRPVIEAVTREALDLLADLLVPEQTHHLDDGMWVCCESCSTLFHVGTGGITCGEENVLLCNGCAENFTPAQNVNYVDVGSLGPAEALAYVERVKQERK